MDAFFLLIGVGFLVGSLIIVERIFPGGIAVMTILYALAAILAVLLLIYLFAAMLRPEWF